LIRTNTDLDTRINTLEIEWRHAYESSNAARSHYQSLVSSKCTSRDVVCQAREQLGHAEALRDQVLEKIKRMEIKSMENQRRIARRFG
jgi:hypothetical protein